MFMYYYFNVCILIMYVPFCVFCVIVLFSVLCVNVYCTAANGCQSNCSKQTHHIISYHIISTSRLTESKVAHCKTNETPT